jgi:hypothetical protein
VLGDIFDKNDDKSSIHEAFATEQDDDHKF